MHVLNNRYLGILLSMQDALECKISRSKDRDAYGILSIWNTIPEVILPYFKVFEVH